MDRHVGVRLRTGVRVKVGVRVGVQACSSSPTLFPLHFAPGVGVIVGLGVGVKGPSMDTSMRVMSWTAWRPSGALT